MGLHGGHDQVAMESLQRRDGTSLILSGEAAVPDDIGRHHGRQSLLDARVCHKVPVLPGSKAPRV